MVIAAKVVIVVAVIKRALIVGLIYLLIISSVLAKNVTTSDDGWMRTFGGAGEDVGTSVQETNDGGYIITGSTTSHKKNIAYSWLIKASRIGEIWLIKTDPEGNSIWEKTFGGLGKDIGFAVEQTKDDGYIVAGATKPQMIGDYDIWLIKTDSEETSNGIRSSAVGETIGPTQSRKRLMGVTLSQAAQNHTVPA